jgi:glycerophosphoryl diester phosphodiesterase
MMGEMSMTPHFELQGHRGARCLFPENTLEGFAATLALGVDAIELDVALTADGVAVVTHDSVLNPDITRGPDGAWLTVPGPSIRSLRAAELQQYDVGRLRPGSRYAALYPDQAAHDGARIPTLADVWTLTSISGVRIDAEVKTQPDQPGLTASPAELADVVVSTAMAYGAMARLTIRSFDWRGVRHLQRMHRHIPLVWLTSPRTVADAALWWDGPTARDFNGSVPRAVAASAGAGGGWAPDHVGLTQEEVAEAHDLGLRVLPWTVNLPADMARLIAWGVDGLCTGRSDLAHQVMREAGLEGKRAS